MTAKKQKHNDTVVNTEEKDALLASLKQTMNDLGRLPGLIFAPVIAYVSAHYTKIPDERKSHLKNILDEIKAGGKEGVDKLKNWFGDVISGKGSGKVPVKNKGTKKVSPSQGTKKTESWSDKISHATHAVADKAKETTKKAADATKKATNSAKKTTPKKPVSKKPVSKTAPVKKSTAKPVVKKTVVKKTAPKKIAKQPVQKATPAKKTPVKKPIAKTTAKK